MPQRTLVSSIAPLLAAMVFVTVQPASAAGSLGVSAKDDAGTITVAGVKPGSPADHAGIKVGDAIQRIGGRSLPNLEAVRSALDQLSPGTDVDVDILRNGRKRTVFVRVGASGQDQLLDEAPPVSSDERVPSPRSPGAEIRALVAAEVAMTANPCRKAGEITAESSSAFLSTRVDAAPVMDCSASDEQLCKIVCRQGGEVYAPLGEMCPPSSSLVRVMVKDDLRHLVCERPNGIRDGPFRIERLGPGKPYVAGVGYCLAGRRHGLVVKFAPNTPSRSTCYASGRELGEPTSERLARNRRIAAYQRFQLEAAKRRSEASVSREPSSPQKAASTSTISKDFGWLATGRRLGLVHPDWGQNFAGFFAECDRETHSTEIVISELLDELADAPTGPTTLHLRSRGNTFEASGRIGTDKLENTKYVAVRIATPVFEQLLIDANREGGFVLLHGREQIKMHAVGLATALPRFRRSCSG